MGVVAITVGAADLLGIAGAFLSALGVAVTLWGTRTTRTAFRRLRRLVFGPVVHTAIASATVSPPTINARVDMPTPTVKVSPGEREWTDEEWRTEFERRIDAVVTRLDGHDHHGTEASLEKLRSEDERIRADIERKLLDLDAKGQIAERWNVAGLVLAFFGAALQGLAVFG